LAKRAGWERVVVVVVIGGFVIGGVIGGVLAPYVKKPSSCTT